MNRPLAAASAALLAASLSPVAALGQPDDGTRAQTLLDEARKAYLAGDYGRACPKYEEVVELRPGLGARVGLGDCYRSAGKLAAAWEVYAGIAEDAPDVAAKATLAKDKETAFHRASEARARMSEIEPRLAWLTIRVPEAVRALPGLEIERNGTRVSAKQWDTRRPAAEGEIHLSARATNKRVWRKTIRMQGAGTSVSVDIDALEDATEPAGPAPTVTTANTPTAPTHALTRAWTAPRIAGVALGTAGIGALVAGSIFGVSAITHRDLSNADGHCNSANVCDSIGRVLRIEGVAAGNGSTALFIGGAALLAGGVVLFATAPRSPAAPAATLLLGPQSVLVRGRW